MKYALLLTAFIVMGYSTESNHQKAIHSINDPAFVSLDIKPNSNGCVVTFVQTGEDIAAELRGLPEGAVSDSEKAGSRALT